MNQVEKIFSGPTVEALGWTLLHSTWQALVVFAIIWVITKLSVRASSFVRYTIACAGMVVILASSITTFILIKAPVTAENGIANTSHFIFAQEVVRTPELQSGLSSALNIIDSNISLIVFFWIFGASLFAFRLLGGWWYLNKLQREANFIQGIWSARLNEMSMLLNINRYIQLAECHLVNTPMVLGYLKPIVLVPVGMFSGLTTEELETILLHELAHIKRHDYFINIIQSIIEVIFFFNPFVWMISGMIRSEREYCCDDTVISKNGNVRAYAHALARLEESRLQGNVLALSLADNKNQLLKRIKRIMERSFKPQMGKDRIVPLILLAVGLLCASWLTIQNDRDLFEADARMQAADTLKPKKQKFSSQTLNVPTPDGEQQQVDIEPFEGGDVIPAFPVMPNMTIALQSLRALPPLPAIPRTYFDTIPKPFRYDADKWEQFSEKFEEEFKDRFSDFYNNHEEDFQAMMEDLKHNFENDLVNLEELQVDIAALTEEQVSIAQDLALEAQADAFRNMEEWQKTHAEDLKQWAEDMKTWEEENREHMQNMEKNMKHLEKKMKEFEKELKAELVKDRYLGENESIKDMHWSKNGDIEINGKKIKEADKKKYSALHDKYFEDQKGDIQFVE